MTFFSYKEKKYGIMVWGDKNDGEERREPQSDGICKFGRNGAAESSSTEDRRSDRLQQAIRIRRKAVLRG